MIYTIIMLFLLIKKLEANEISTLKSLWLIGEFYAVSAIFQPCNGVMAGKAFGLSSLIGNYTL